jgi:hypothetical protein
MEPRYDLLEALCRDLVMVKREDFNFASYYSENWKGGKPGCGTTACALGHAPFVPEIAAAGLSVVCELNGNCLFFINSGPLMCGIPAAAKIFGLSWAEVNYLFGPHATHDELNDAPPGSATPAEVAEHIRKFCAWRRENPA